MRNEQLDVAWALVGTAGLTLTRGLGLRLAITGPTAANAQVTCLRMLR